MILGKHSEVIYRDDKVVLANRELGCWTRVSLEVFEIIKEIIDTNSDISVLEENFESEEDYFFVKSLYDSLVEMNIISDKDYTSHMVHKIISIQLTNRCNLKCTHCCVDAENSWSNDNDLSTDEIKEVIDKAIVWNPLNIMLSGGEPMIRDDFMEIVTYLRRNYSGKIILSTNSLFINEKNVETLVTMCDSFEISIDGVDEETCAPVRGKGVFEKVCSKIELLNRYGAANINLSMVFSDKNEHLKDEFRKLNERLGTNPVCRIFSAIGRGVENRAQFTNTTEEDVYIPQEYIELENTPFGITTCSAGKCEIIIGQDGTLYPCPSYMNQNFAMGNVLNVDAIEDLLKEAPCEYVCEHVSKFHPNNLKKCNNCDVKLFCWTCPGELLDIKTKSAFEKRCSITRPMLSERVWESDILF